MDLSNDDESSGGLSPGRESELLAEPPATDAPASLASVAQDAAREDFFVDRKMEFTYLDVSTLYYPARPE